MWSVAEAKTHLSEILRRARAGEPQTIGTQDPCVLISADTFKKKIVRDDGDGAWLVAQAAHVAGDIELPDRAADRSVAFDE